MELMNSYDRRIWHWWVMSDIISKSNDKIRVQSQKHDNESPVCAAVHKELLCFYSPYYTAAIKGGFSESRKDLLTLRLSASQTRLFVEWLYTGLCDRGLWDEDDLYALYIFADQTDIIALRRTITTRLRSMCRARVTPGEMARLVSQLPRGSGLRRFLLEEALFNRTTALREGKVATWDWEQQGYVPEDFPEDFYAQLVNGHIENNGEGRSSLLFSNPCNYHEHENGEEWKMTCGRNFISRYELKPELKYFRNPSADDQVPAALCSGKKLIEVNTDAQIAACSLQ